MILEIFPSGLFETNAMIIGSEKTREIAIVDPAPDSAKKIKKYIEKNALKPKAILITHSHWDHIVDAAGLKKDLGVPIYIHPDDAENLIHPGSDNVPVFYEMEGVQPDYLIKDGDSLRVGGLEIEVIHTPGHTPGGVCYYIPKEKILLSGDTLFKGSIGNLSFPTAREGLMWDSLKKLAKLPPDTKVYPGHGESTTIGAEDWLDDAERVFG